MRTGQCRASQNYELSWGCTALIINYELSGEFARRHTELFLETRGEERQRAESRHIGDFRDIVFPLF